MTSSSPTPIRSVQADSRVALPFKDKVFDCVVTSPPYFGLRKYGDSDREVGIGSLNDYLFDLLAVFDEIGRVLKDDGLAWLNIGDTAAQSGGAGGDYNKGGAKEGKPRYRQGNTGLKGPQLCLVPERAAIGLQNDGWLVRSVITWDKLGLRPEDLSHTRRPGLASETILMLAKQRKHRFFHEGLYERGNVWHFKPSRGKNHLAPFPDELPRRCINISTVPGDLVLDPFSGSGTTARVADSMGRVGVGVDLY